MLKNKLSAIILQHPPWTTPSPNYRSRLPDPGIQILSNPSVSKIPPSYPDSPHLSPGSSEDRTVIDRLSFSFPRYPLFLNFSLQANRKIIVLKGPSGCGKTTLLRLLFGSFEKNEDAVIPFFENPVMVLQEDALFPWLTGRENIERFIRISRSSVEGHALFPVVAPFIDRPCYQMSYGQRRAVELFRALLNPPEAVFLDEPFNYLDDSKTDAYIDHLLSPAWSRVLTIITTHRHDTSLDAASNVFHFEGLPPYSQLTRTR